MKRPSLAGYQAPGDTQTPHDVVKRLKLLEDYNFNFLLLGLSPKRLLRDGRLFDNEQVLPLLLYYAQWDKRCRYWTSEIVRQWLFFNPSDGDFEIADNAEIVAFRDYFFKEYAVPLIEEFRKFVALTMIFPDRPNAPPGPIDMVWHSFILCTDAYWKFGKSIWIGAPHIPPEVKEEWLKDAASPHASAHQPPQTEGTRAAPTSKKRKRGS